MRPQHRTLLLACVMNACSAAPETSAEGGSTGGAEASSSGPAAPTTGEDPGTPTDTGTVDAGSTSAVGSTSSASGGETTSGETTSGGASSDEGGSSETGATDCAPIWAVPEVPADALASHDLLWIGCGYTACDLGEPGDPGVLCAPFDLAGVPLDYLGHMDLDDAEVFTTADVVSPNSFGWLDGPRHIYRYDEHIYLATEGDAARDQLDVYFAVRALELLRSEHPYVYEQLVTVPRELPDAPPLDGLNWKNRLRAVVLSFDTSPLYIAAGLTILDAAPVADMQTMLDEYSNVAAISIDRETILGSSPDVGSRPIYGEASDDENYLHYLREGLVETVVHELLHTRVDRLNSVDDDMRGLWNRRGDPNACAGFELEEALVAASSLLHFREAGGFGDEYLDYYDVVLDANLEIVAACPEYAMWMQAFTLPSGVDPRYDLRLFDLE